jgi:ATPase subunit of ABC transporter with duplicated ATPase domains
MASFKYIYVMKELTKNFPGGREVFKGITLSFLPGVKIGVLGVNGAGKSTLMKIMAGIETEYGGEAWARNRRWIPPRRSARTSRKRLLN